MCYFSFSFSVLSSSLVCLSLFSFPLSLFCWFFSDLSLLFLFNLFFLFLSMSFLLCLVHPSIFSYSSFCSLFYSLLLCLLFFDLPHCFLFKSAVLSFIFSYYSILPTSLLCSFNIQIVSSLFLLYSVFVEPSI